MSGSDYEPDDRRPRRIHPERRPDRKLWVILGICGAVAALGLAACGGLVIYGAAAARDMFRQIGPATAAAEAFLNQIQAGQVQPAYQSSSSGFRSAQTPEQFAAFVAKFPALGGHTGRAVSGTNMMTFNGVRRFRIQYTLTAPNTGANCTLTLVEQNGAWVVDTLTVP